MRLLRIRYLLELCCQLQCSQSIWGSQYIEWSNLRCKSLSVSSPPDLDVWENLSLLSFLTSPLIKGSTTRSVGKRHARETPLVWVAGACTWSFIQMSGPSCTSSCTLAHATGTSCASAKAHSLREWSFFVRAQTPSAWAWNFICACACHLPGCQSWKIGDCCFNKTIPIFNLESTDH